MIEKLECLNVEGHVCSNDGDDTLIQMLYSSMGDGRENMNSFLLSLRGEENFDSEKKDRTEKDKENPNIPFYRNGLDYKGEFEEGKVKKLTIHCNHLL